MKKMVNIVLVLVLMIFAVSCGDDSKSDKKSNDGDTTAADSDLVVADEDIKTDTDEVSDTENDSTPDLEPDEDGVIEDVDTVPGDGDVVPADDFALGADWLTGRFSSQKQSEEPGSLYFDIRLFIHRIWEERTDGVWMYLEQARVDTMTAPYRQRVYHFFVNDEGQYQNRNYEFKNPAPFTNPWENNMEDFKGLAPEEILVVVEGCDVYMEKVGDHFEGGTHEKDCKSTYNGAVYATSEFTLSSTKMESWDKGFDANDKQVFGPTAGPYIFDKIENLPY